MLVLFEICICITAYAKLDANRLNGIIVSKHVESLDSILKRTLLNIKIRNLKSFWLLMVISSIHL